MSEDQKSTAVAEVEAANDRIAEASARKLLSASQLNMIDKSGVSAVAFWKQLVAQNAEKLARSQ